jgi:hypothetical protein
MSEQLELPVFRAASSETLLDRYRWAKRMGATFGGARDVYTVLGYDEVITIQQYRDRYSRGGIAKRIIDVFPNATWRGKMELVEDENPEVTTPFEKAWEDLDTKFQIQAKLRRADKLSLLSTYAILLIGAPGDLSEELPKGSPDQLLYFTPFLGGGGPPTLGKSASRSNVSEADATIAEFDLDPTSPRFGLPKSYNLKRVDASSAAFAKPVHWSRVIHIAEDLLENEVEGPPGLECVWNLLLDLDKVTGGGAEAFWLRANQGMHIDIDKDMPLADAEAEKKALAAQADLYKHQVQRWLRTRGVTVEPMGSDVANFQNPADAILTQIAGAKGIPKRILTGSEMGELASSQDRENWRDQIIGRQTGYAGPYIVRPLVERLVTYGYLPMPKKGLQGFEAKWPNMSIMTEDERTKGAASWATTQTAAEGQVFTNAEIRKKWYEMAPLSPAEQEKLKPAPVAPELGPDGKPIEDDEEAEGKVIPFKPRASAELVRVLEDALESNNVEVIDRVLGLER